MNQLINKNEKKLTLKLGSWNVRTMTTGMDTDIYNTTDARKAAIINNELFRLKVDIAALQETRLAGQGSIIEKDLTFF